MSDMSVADRYSRLVLWLKVSLPIVALAILSTLFFVAETLDPEAAIPYAEVDVERILREQGASRPTFGGVTERGVAISLSAESVRPDENREILKGVDLKATLQMPDGGRIDIDSPFGFVDSVTQEATLEGGARLESSAGYIVEAERIVASVSEARVVAETEVRGFGPVGDITAGAMEVTRPETAEGYLIVFKEGVRLVYRPEP